VNAHRKHKSFWKQEFAVLLYEKLISTLLNLKRKGIYSLCSIVSTFVVQSTIQTFFSGQPAAHVPLFVDFVVLFCCKRQTVVGIIPNMFGIVP